MLWYVLYIGIQILIKATNDVPYLQTIHKRLYSCIHGYKNPSHLINATKCTLHKDSNSIQINNQYTISATARTNPITATTQEYKGWLILEYKIKSIQVSLDAVSMQRECTHTCTSDQLNKICESHDRIKFTTSAKDIFLNVRHHIHLVIAALPLQLHHRLFIIDQICILSYNTQQNIYLHSTIHSNNLMLWWKGWQ